MSHVYRVPMAGGKFKLVQATSGPRARSELRKLEFPEDQDVTRLTSGQVVAAMKAGVDVIVVDADPIDETIQQDLEFAQPAGDGGEGND